MQKCYLGLCWKSYVGWFQFKGPFGRPDSDTYLTNLGWITAPCTVLRAHTQGSQLGYAFRPWEKAPDLQLMLEMCGDALMQGVSTFGRAFIFEVYDTVAMFGIWDHNGKHDNIEAPTVALRYKHSARITILVTILVASEEMAGSMNFWVSFQTRCLSRSLLMANTCYLDPKAWKTKAV